MEQLVFEFYDIEVDIAFGNQMYAEKKIREWFLVWMRYSIEMDKIEKWLKCQKQQIRADLDELMSLMSEDTSSERWARVGGEGTLVACL